MPCARRVEESQGAGLRRSTSWGPGRANRLFPDEGVVPGAAIPGWRSRSSEDGSSHTAHLEDLDVPDATAGAGFACPDLTTFARLDELGLHVTGQRLEPGRAVLACRVVEPDDWCRRCA